MFLPNPNTGLPLEPDGIWPAGGEFYKGKNITATNRVIFGPSKLTLPVVKVSDLPRIGPLILPVPKKPPGDEELVRMGKQALKAARRAEAGGRGQGGEWAAMEYII